MTVPAAPASEPGELPLDVILSQTVGTEFQSQLAELVPLLVRDLADIDRRMHEVLGATYPRLTDAATYACSAGGKRVRPVLMAALHRALGATDTRPVHSLAAAFQLIHTATLVHDDVIDHAEMRRGRPSLPQAFGLPLAIVAGDYLFVRAFELASEYPRSIIMRCGEACADLVEGEVLQESGRFDLTTGREHYYRVIERKTAAIVAAALGSVAEIQGAPVTVQDAAAAYGRSLGIAFQIRDDLLDVYGDSDVLGKPLYGDFREGNPTLVGLETYEGLDGNRRAEFERLFGLRRKQPGDLLRLRALVDAAGAPERVAAVARQWAERAIRSLEGLPPTPYRLLLEEMARGAAERRF
ncbi:MAG: polyprenyl synthetase family protein [Thermoplasmata archaeon]|nr:polyprenyl synthetase family protein [Thermoplasmata archaeon]MCI4355576.1 polyprenyl synthetase family protein [Thermoplasmata archaeon]